MSETFFFVNPSAFARHLRQMCACKGSYPRSGLFCDLETRALKQEYQFIDFACHVCRTPYEVRLALSNPKQVMFVTGTMVP